MEKIYLSDVIRDSIDYVGSSMYDMDEIIDICDVDLSNVKRLLRNIRDPETQEYYDCGFTVKLGKPIGSEDDTESADTKSVKTNTEEPSNNIAANYVTVMTKAAAGRVAYKMIGRTDSVSFTVSLGYSDLEDEESNLISYNVFVEKSGVGYRIQKKKRDQKTTYTVYESDENAVNGRRRIASYGGRRLQFSTIVGKMRMFLEKPQAYLESAEVTAMRNDEIEACKNAPSRGTYRKPLEQRRGRRR